MRFVRKVGRRGILTVPNELRELLEINEGDIVEFDLLAVVRKKRDRAERSLDSNTTPVNA